MPPRRIRYTLGFAAAALGLVLAVAGILNGARTYQDDTRWVRHTLEVMSAIDHVHAELLQGIAAHRTYLLSGDPAARATFVQSRPRVRADLSRLGMLVQHDPVQSRRVVSLGVLVEQRLDLAQETLRRFEADGLSEAQAHMRRNHGSAVGAAVDALVDEFHDEQRDLLRARAGLAATSARLLLVTGAVAIPSSLAILLALSVLLGREMRQRARAETHAQALNADLQRHVAALERAGADLAVLGHYTGLLQSSRSVEEAIEVTQRTLAELLPGVAGTLYLQRASQDYFEARGGWGRHGAESPGIIAPQDCWALRRAQPHAVDDVRRDMHCPHTRPPGEGLASTACLPLTAQAVNLGLLYLSARTEGPVPNLEVARAAAEQLSLALGNLHLQETLRHQSIRDALTGLYNRRYLEASLAREVARCERRGVPLAVLMLDLDHFKAFNDAHGHDAGDVLLAAVGRVLLDHSRAEDIPCRYGGEEFTLILSETTREVALARAGALRAAIEQLQVPHQGTTFGGMTTSIGLAVHPDDASGPSTLLKAADEALYAAKRKGRNRVESADAAGTT